MKVVNSLNLVRKTYRSFKVESVSGFMTVGSGFFSGDGSGYWSTSAGTATLLKRVENRLYYGGGNNPLVSRWCRQKGGNTD